MEKSKDKSEPPAESINAAPLVATPTNDEEGGNEDAPRPVNLQLRQGKVEATRYGDWELNGRCIDF